MKRFLTTVATALMIVGSASSAVAEKQTPGPKGGKLLENDAPRAEFFVEADHTVTITFYDDKLTPVPAASQVVTATAEAGGSKTKLEFEKKGDVLVSKAPLPHGDGYNIVVQVKQDAAAKAQNYRIKYDTHICGECQRQEYACTCDE